ncbi:MAG: SDR family NAD(P)-dependent oxidoreductase [Pollutimonas bauzanensis]|uniref:NAD(P)-dependent dehydrogenase, short-chain alcohol dehydrogenase family n=1 Tax=Pollutimonas bauzanensis TaxID=658167 RepID=A0A1M5SG64_9BURK|nr:SDR family NAD(P)-dependent oxidoreductase [Pollutimonas bauzanensis]SHH37577.1 NAD(P)-dependent dehydrogenase, short-chain alcohol dehydrogenase family [Pollutimonas bauzanensis]
MPKRLKDRVAIVTGAGGGLGRTHALELARHGARVVVNDLSGSAQAVADEICEAGGEAIAYAGDVTRYDEMEAMAAQAISKFGRIDILVNNAGILRDRTFAKMPLDEFRLVLDVHVMGSVNATKAAWTRMQSQNYGRIVMTTSSSGLYGNFGQSNYGAAKMALVGLMQTLSLEGARHNIHVNCLAPSAMTAMTEGLLPQAAAAVLTPERVSPGLIALVGEDAPTRMILLAGGGSFECAHITMTRGIHVGDSDDPAEALCKRMAQVQAQADQVIPASGWEQPEHELAKALARPR